MNHPTARQLGHWKITVALAALAGVAALIDFHSWYYWTAVGIYVAHVTYALFVDGAIPFGRRPSWRRKDSRTTDGDARS